MDLANSDLSFRIITFEKESYINKKDMIKFFQYFIREKGDDALISPKDVVYMLMEHTP
jgi:hypothetical protein